MKLNNSNWKRKTTMSILFSGLFVMYRFMHKLANAVFSWFNLNWLRLDWRWSRRNYVHAAKEGREKRVPNWSKPEMRSSWPNGIFERLLEVKNIPTLFFLFKSWHPYKAKETLDHSPPPHLPSDLWCFLVFFCLKNCYNDGITCCFNRQLCERRLFVF